MNDEGNVTAAAVLSTESADKKTEGAMEDETAKRLARIEEGLSLLARELLNVKSVPPATERLVRGMDARLRLLTKLIDRHHQVLETHGFVPPAGGSSDVN